MNNKIIQYGIELNEEKLNILVKEKEYLFQNEELNNPDKIFEIATKVLKLDRKAEEYFYVLAMNSQNEIIGVFQASHGTVNQSLVGAREVFLRLVLCGAVHFVALHNHPSGTVTPSQDDVKTTKRLMDAGKLLGIPLIDHLIIGRNTYLSFASEGIFKNWK